MLKFVPKVEFDRLPSLLSEPARLFERYLNGNLSPVAIGRRTSASWGTLRVQRMGC